MRHFEEINTDGSPSVSDFYSGKTIFMTGASGFMGNVLLEKLLRSCSELERVYVLLRPKRSTSPEERLKNMFSNELYDQLKKEKPGILESKVVAMAGDVIDIGLGLSQEDRALLADKVNIIFHVAASVRFDDDLRQAVRINLRSAVEIVQLAKEMKNLQALVHVSTAYSNVKYSVEIEEKMYPPYADWRETMRISEEVDVDTLNILQSKYICGLPNTYVFTKQLAEHVINDARGQLPVVIVRPTMVGSIMEDPVPGWHHTINGIAGMYIGCGTGVLVSLNAKNLKHDYVAVDLAAKVFIVAAWYRGIRRLKHTDELDIYNCSSGDRGIPLKTICERGQRASDKFPQGITIGYTNYTYNTGLTHYLKVFIYQLLVALMIDACLFLAGKELRMTKIQRKIYKADIAVSYFLLHEWLFSNKNMLSLRSRLKEQDRDSFYYDFDKMDEQQYMDDVVYGARYHLLKRSDADLPRDRALRKIFLVMSYAFYFLLYSYVAWKVMSTTCFQNALDTARSFF